LKQDLIINFVREIADKDVEVVRSVLFVGIVGLVGPIDPDFLSSAY
jgi:hypothetical protein